MLSSETFISTDTLQQARPAYEAFIRGKLAEGTDAVTGSGWSLVSGLTATDCWMTGICLLLVIAYFRSFLSVYPHISNGIANWRKFVSMENNLRLCRERDTVWLVSLLIFCISASILDILPTHFLTTIPAWSKILAVSGIILCTFLLRYCLIAVIPVRRSDHETVMAAHSILKNMIIAISPAMLFLLLLATISEGCFEGSGKIWLYLTGAMWFIFIIRKYQIMSGGNGQFRAFLYLCAVEILPAGLLTAAMLTL